MKSIDELYEQILIESKYASGGRDAMTGIFLLALAIVIFLLSMILYNEAFEGSFYFWILTIPSLVFGFLGLLLYLRGKDTMKEAITEQKQEQPQEKKD